MTRDSPQQLDQDTKRTIPAPSNNRCTSYILIWYQKYSHVDQEDRFDITCFADHMPL